jgi:hypothetical protein
MRAHLSKIELLSLIAEHEDDYWFAQARGWGNQSGEIEETIHRLYALLAKAEGNE